MRRLLRGWLDRVERELTARKRLGWLLPLHEAVDTILFTPGRVTRRAPHVRDGLDMKRLMSVVVVALLPCVFMALYNTGYQANHAIAQGALPLPGWRTALYTGLGFTYDPTSPFLNILLGALYYVPVVAATFAAGACVELAFAAVRKRPLNEGFLVTGMLIPLILPPAIPLWQVMLGTAFGVTFGKEIFGGTGMNFLNPALVSRAFLFFAYPAEISGTAPWVAAELPGIDAYSGATLLSRAATDGAALESASWMQSFLGLVPGSMGETSALACLLGAGLLIVTGVGSWRTMAGVTLGTFMTATLLNVIGSPTNPMFEVPFHWHIVLGGWAIGTAFMATDPVSSAFTDVGKWWYGGGIGVLCVLIRTVNPAYPEGMMLAILLMNVFAPLIDHWVVEAHIRRRMRRA